MQRGSSREDSLRVLLEDFGHSNQLQSFYSLNLTSLQWLFSDDGHPSCTEEKSRQFNVCVCVIWPSSEYSQRFSTIMAYIIRRVLATPWFIYAVKHADGRYVLHTHNFMLFWGHYSPGTARQCTRQCITHPAWGHDPVHKFDDKMFSQ